jgi:hypothetical protein
MLASAEINRAAYAVEIAAINPKRRRRTVTGTLELIDLTTGVSADRDEVLVLRLKQGGTFFPGKRISATDGKVVIKDYSGGSWFKPLALIVDNLDSLHRAFVALAEGTYGAGFSVRGGLVAGADPRSVTRRKHSKPTIRKAGAIVERGMPQGLIDIGRRWLVIDVDDLPNSWGVDPRTSGADAVAAIIADLFPPELAGTRYSWQWGSSACALVSKDDPRPLPAGQPPETLSLHVRYWLDTPLAEQHVRGVLKRLKQFVVDKMAANNLSTGGALIVDPAPGVYNQAVYDIRPDVTGMPDPLPGSLRYGLVEAGQGRDAVRVDVLLEQLPTPAVLTERQLTPEQRALRREAMQLAVAKRRAATVDAASAVPDLAPVAVQVKDGRYVKATATTEATLTTAYCDKTADASTRRQKGLWRAKMIFRTRALEDIVRIVESRKLTDPVWLSGVPKGRRANVMFAVGSLLSWTLATDGHNFGPRMLNITTLKAAIAEYAARLVSPDWFRDEWQATGADANILSRALAAKAGHSRSAKSHPAYDLDPRSDPDWEYLVDLLRPTVSEMVGLNLRALITEAVRQHQRRRAAGKPTLSQRRVNDATTSEKATRPWEAAGISQRTWQRRRKALTAAIDVPPEQRKWDCITDDAARRTASASATKLMIATAAEGVRLNVSLLATEYHNMYTASTEARTPGPTAVLEPWEQAGISRATWFRRQNAARLAQDAAREVQHAEWTESGVPW